MTLNSQHERSEYDANQRMVARDPGFLPGRVGRDEEDELARPPGGRGHHGRRDRRVLPLRLLPVRGRLRAVLADRQAVPRGGGARMTTKTGETLPAAEAAGGKGKSWFIVHTYSGFEERVRQNLKQRVEAMGMADAFGDIRIPTETLVEMKGGKRREIQRKFFPGYIIVEMEMSDEAWHLVKNTPKVTGFVGSGKEPPPLTA